MLHEEVAKFLGKQEVLGGRLAADADKDLGRGRELRQRAVGRGGYLAERGDCVRGLAFGEERDGDVDEFVTESLVAVEGGIAGV